MSDYEPVFDEFTCGADDILEFHRQDDEDERDYDGCMCGDRDCPECGSDCMSCGGEGMVDGGELNDPLWYTPGHFYTCRNCGGTGNRQDMTFW